ncbi:MAG: hypothetical protein C5B60_03120 [Chloroflexi bacterium]|nr:MAG: hypothetical protein C5B60_03120 [Chloroflexota bacterium]
MSSLADKLGLRPGQRYRLLEAPAEAAALLSEIAPLFVTISVDEPEKDAPRSDLLFFWPHALEGLVERLSLTSPGGSGPHHAPAGPAPR